MKKLILCFTLMSALLLSGCGHPTSAESVTTVPTLETQTISVSTTEASTEAPTTVPLCKHQWGEACYLTPAICQLCGEVGNYKTSFFDENKLDIRDTPFEGTSKLTKIETEGVMYSRKSKVTEPDTIKFMISDWQISNCTSEDGNYQEITIRVDNMRHSKIRADGVDLDTSAYNYGIYDYYTGQWIHPAREALNGKDTVSFDLQVDDMTYTIQYTDSFNTKCNAKRELEDGAILYDEIMTETYTFTVPQGYDGLVLGILPCRDTRGFNKTENGKYVTNLCEEGFFEEGVYFRLNQDLSPN